MKHEVKIGQTDYTVLVRVLDDAGVPKTGLTDAGIDLAYARVETDNDVTTSDVAPASLSALTDAHTDWGFKEVSATDHPGVYRLDIADAVFASGAWSAVVSLTATGVNPTSIEFAMVPVAPADGVNTHTVAGTTPETSSDFLTATVDGAITVAQALAVIMAACAGKASGLGTTTATFRDINDTRNAIVATVDADGNRSAVTIDHP